MTITELQRDIQEQISLFQETMKDRYKDYLLTIGNNDLSIFRTIKATEAKGIVMYLDIEDTTLILFLPVLKEGVQQ